MAMPPRSCALRDASAPESLPIGVRAVETITEPGMGTPVRTAPVGYRSVGATIVVLVSHVSSSPTRWVARHVRMATTCGAPLPSPPMTTEIDAIRTAVLEGAPGDELASLKLPE